MQQHLVTDLRNAEEIVQANVHRPLTPGQYDALVSLTYNAGRVGARPMFDAINRLGPEAAAHVLLTTAIHVTVRDPRNPHYVTGRVISRGLQNRRHRELAVYQGGQNTR